MQNPRTAIVSGGGGQIGNAIVEKMLKDGYNVAAVSRSKRENHDDNSNFLAVRADIADPSQVERAVECAQIKFGAIDILVNNAGITGPIKPIQQISLEEWNETVLVNLTGAFVFCKCVVPIMIQGERGGRIVNISSMSGKRPVAFRTPYSASKMGLIGLTRSLSAELGKYGITVNAICPGPIEGNRMNEIINQYAKLRNTDTESIRRRMIGEAALARFTKAEEVANLVSYLTSKEAEAITGQDFNINAGTGS